MTLENKSIFQRPVLKAELFITLVLEKTVKSKGKIVATKRFVHP